MNTVPIALLATVVAAALTWFFCMRPMLLNQKNQARKELDRPRAAGSGRRPVPGAEV